MNETSPEIKDCVLEEYRLIRAEILQYLEEYQTVRNMMFTVTGTLLGFGVATGNPYLLLLPILVIIPSYFIAICYERCVNVAATYLKVFYEQKEGFPIRWETRKVYLDLYLRKVSEKYVTKFNTQTLPYKISALACVGIYFVTWWINHRTYWSGVIMKKIDYAGLQGLAGFALGAVALIAVFLTIFRFESESFETCWKAWEEIEQREKAGKIAVDARTAYSDIKNETAAPRVFQRVRWILTGRKPKELRGGDVNSTGGE